MVIYRCTTSVVTIIHEFILLLYFPKYIVTEPEPLPRDHPLLKMHQKVWICICIELEVFFLLFLQIIISFSFFSSLLFSILLSLTLGYCNPSSWQRYYSNSIEDGHYVRWELGFGVTGKATQMESLSIRTPICSLQVRFHSYKGVDYSNRFDIRMIYQKKPNKRDNDNNNFGGLFILE